MTGLRRRRGSHATWPWLPEGAALPDLPPVVVLGGSFHALSLARSLGPRGVEVHLLGHGRGLPGVARSRFIRGFHATPQGEDPSPYWRTWLANRPGGSVVFPACDEGLEFVGAHRDELLGDGWFPIESDPTVLLQMLDKERTYELAGRVGVRAPRVHRIEGLADARAFAHEVGFPCAVKPVTSHEFSRSLAGSFAGKGAVVATDFDLRVTYEELARSGVPLLLTELVPGDDTAYVSYFSYLDDQGSPLVHLTKRKPRQYPIGFGLGTFHETRWYPEVAELGLRFFRGVGLRGIGNVEFKRSARTGELVLIECNARITAADTLLRRAGIDLVELAYLRALGIRDHVPVPVPAPTFRQGLTLWLPGRDLRALRQYLATGELRLGAWAASLAPPPILPIFDWRDPVPSLGNLARVTRRARRGGVPSTVSAPRAA